MRNVALVGLFALGAATMMSSYRAMHFTIVADSVASPAAQNLKVQITRAFPAAADTYTSVRCAL